MQQKKQDNKFELDDDKLETAVGGYDVKKRSIFYRDQFKLTEDECMRIFEKNGVALMPGTWYKSDVMGNALNVKKTSGAVQKALDNL